MRRIAFIVILLALPVALYLSQKTQIFAPGAQEIASLGSMPVKVLVLNYFPLDESGTQLNSVITGSTKTLDEVRNWTNVYTQQGLLKLTGATKYHGYKNSSAPAYLNYSVLETKEFLKTIPKNPNYDKPDYMKILTEDVNICDYIDNRGVRQVWMWGYHFGNIAPDESNMSMGTKSKSFWNHGDQYGDISNSSQINDMPTCQNTYTLYNYNFDRALGELLEDHGHQIESLMSYIDGWIWGWQYMSPHGATGSTINRCGTIHAPPNTGQDYDWNNQTNALSDCEDWKPDRSGQTKTVSCHTWQGESCPGDSGVAFKVWWMQNMPGYQNGITCQNGGTVRNWWEFYGDLDQALTQGKNLISGNCSYPSSSVTIATPSPSPTPTKTPSSTPRVSPTPTITPNPSVTPTASPETIPTATSSPTPEPKNPVSQVINLARGLITKKTPEPKPSTKEKKEESPVIAQVLRRVLAVFQSLFSFLRI